MTDPETYMALLRQGWSHDAAFAALKERQPKPLSVGENVWILLKGIVQGAVALYILAALFYGLEHMK